MVGGLPVLRRVGTAAGSNRRIRKTVRPVVWEGAGAQSPVPDPIPTQPSPVVRVSDGTDPTMQPSLRQQHLAGDWTVVRVRATARQTLPVGPRTGLAQ